MFPYTYTAYWREVGATDWNKIESPTPITWDTKNIPGGSPTGFPNGQCVGSFYSVSFQRFASPSGVITNLGFGNQPGPIISLVGSLSGSIFNSTLTRGSISNGTYGTRTQSANIGEGNTATIQNVVITLISGSDDCGASPDYNPGGEASCETTFSTGLIITRPQCIEVTLNPPECECCRELLPKANSILARLG